MLLFSGFTARRHEDDSTSVDLWVEYMNLKYGTNSPVLFYKKLGNSDEKYNHLRSDDFMLVIATEFQLEMLQQFGSKKICVDGTHGLNSYRYQLFTVLIIDEFSNGVPAGYCFTNRYDTGAMEIFFSIMKSRVTPTCLSTEILMSDDDPVFINAWTNAVAPPTKHLLCTWHVNKNWLEHLSSIKHPEKKKLVRDTLYQLRCENSEDEFKNYLENFVNDLLEDEDTKEFGNYFKSYYAPPNRFVKWAYAFRKHTGINCNMYLESLHKLIKHTYLKGTKCRRLDKAIDALMILTRDKMFDRIIKLSKRKLSEKMIRIDESHKKSLNITREDIICDGDDENIQNAFRWFIKSSSGSIWYTVQLIVLSCPESLCKQKCKLCDVCIHHFQCSCPDNTIYFNLCKHIHAVKRWHSIQTEDNNSTEEDVLQATVQFLPAETDEGDEHIIRIRALLENTLAQMLEQRPKKEECEVMERDMRRWQTMMNGDGKKAARKKFQIKDKISIRKNVSPQKRFVSAKKQRKIHKFPQISAAKSMEIRKCLSGSDSLNLNSSSSLLDHLY